MPQNLELLSMAVLNPFPTKFLTRINFGINMVTNKWAFKVLVYFKVAGSIYFYDLGEFSFPQMYHLQYLSVAMETEWTVNQIKLITFSCKMRPNKLKALLKLHFNSAPGIEYSKIFFSWLSWKPGNRWELLKKIKDIYSASCLALFVPLFELVFDGSL